MTNTIRREHSHACGNKTCHRFWLDCTPKKSWFRYIAKFHNDKIKRILHREGL